MSEADPTRVSTDFADRVDRVSISGIREVFEAADADAINLGLGQPDFPTPDHVRQAAIEAIEAGDVDGYTSNRGIEPFREAVADRYAADRGLDVDPADVIATAGASEALHLAMQAHVEPGDEVIVPDPGFVSYEALTHVAGGEPVPVGLRDDLTLDPAAVEAAITDDTAAFVVNSPANPTGAVQSADDMRAFARIADERGVVCISDEVYEHFLFDGEHRSPMEFAASDRVVVASGCSKTYAMTGWRIGWVTASERRIERMLRVHQYAQACASAPAQHAGEAALSGSQEPVAEMCAAFAERRDVLLDGLDDLGLDTPTPRGAFYALPAVPDGFVDACIDRDVIVVPGEAFGAEGAGRARISYAAGSESIEEALEIMGDALRSL
jgi:aspartate aminotransferase